MNKKYETREKKYDWQKIKFRAEEPEDMWVCKCECGNIRVVSGDDLISGKVTSCGECDDKPNLQGKN